MTTEESTKICFVIQKAYPEQYRTFGKADTQIMIDLWASMCEGYTYDQVNAGLKMFMRSDVKGFPPKPGQVIAQIEKLRPSDDTQMTEAEAWSIIHRAMSRSAYHAEEEFEKLPDTLKRAVGSPENLREWATMEDGESRLPVIESNVMRAYRSAVKMAQEDRLIPDQVRRLAMTMFDQIEQKEAYDDGVRKGARSIAARGNE